MKIFKRIGVYLPILFVLIISTVTLRTIALFNDFNVATGYFNADLLISISNILTFGGAAFLLSFGFVCAKIDVIADFKGPGTYIPSGLTSVALVFLSVESLITISSKKGALEGSDSFTDWLLLVASLLAICCVINF